MRRPQSSPRTVQRTGDIRKDLTQVQLAWIGSVALAYNEAEFILDIIVTAIIGQQELGHELTSRINGTEGKIEIIKAMFEILRAEQPIKDSVALTLGQEGFASLKKYRDRIIHARIQDAKNAIALSPASRGKFEEILLTPSGLEGVYTRLILLRYELLCVLQMAIGTQIPVSIKTVLKDMDYFSGDLYTRTPQSESKIQEVLSQLQECRKDRLSLPPLPEFPSESELSAADAQKQQDQQADILKSLGPRPEFLTDAPDLTDRALRNLPPDEKD